MTDEVNTMSLLRQDYERAKKRLDNNYAYFKLQEYLLQDCISCGCGIMDGVKGWCRQVNLRQGLVYAIYLCYDMHRFDKQSY